MFITNNSKEKVKVSVKGFSDPNGDKNINIIKRTEFEEEGDASHVDRKKIWLNITGRGVSVGFESAGTGKMYDPSNYSQLDNGKEIGSLGANGDKMKLELQGAGGTSGNNDSSEPIKDNFNLVLKIERDRQ